VGQGKIEGHQDIWKNLTVFAYELSMKNFYDCFFILE